VEASNRFSNAIFGSHAAFNRCYSLQQENLFEIKLGKLKKNNHQRLLNVLFGLHNQKNIEKSGQTCSVQKTPDCS
jgi:hypothetical protein